MRRLLLGVIFIGLWFGSFAAQRYYKRPVFPAASTSVCDDLIQTNLVTCHDYIEDTPDIQTLTDRIGSNDFLRGPTSGSDTRDPSWVTGDRLDFTNSSTDEYVDGNSITSFGSTDLFADNTTSFTVHLVMIRESATEFAVALGKGGSGGTAQLNLEINTFDRVFIRLRGDSTTLHFDDLAWHMHTITWDGSTGTYYLDDGTGTTLDNVTQAADQTAEITIGCDAGSPAGTSCLDGKVALFVVYDGALSQANVATNCDTVDTDFNANRSINLPCSA